MRFATRAIHAAQPSDPSTGALIAPIYQTSFALEESLGGVKSLICTETPTHREVHSL